MTLSSFSKQQLAKASRDAITDAMGQLPLGAKHPRWLPEGQKYSKANIADALSADYKNGTVDDTALAQRIAASVPSHVVDGWSYFGRAIHCLIRGDTRNSVHLGYYAELRAALAILAAEGIGIFNTQHFIVDKDRLVERLSKKACSPMESRTHKIVWQVYRWWFQQETCRDLVTSIIQPGGYAIRDWFSSPNTRGLYLQPSAEGWFNSWGLDLKRLDRDQGSRNASSYGPSAIHDWQILSGAEAVDIVKRLWELFRPTLFSRFGEVDRLLLHGVVQTIFSSQTKKRRGSKAWHLEFNGFVDGLLEEQTDRLTDKNRVEWNQFLCDDAACVGFPIEAAKKQSTIDSPSFPVEVLARAALLLRIATGSCERHLDEAGIEWDMFRFWLDDIGVRRGFWGRGAYPAFPNELWADISEALESLEEEEQYIGRWEDSPHFATPQLFVSSLTRLEECERIGLWGIGTYSS